MILISLSFRTALEVKFSFNSLVYEKDFIQGLALHFQEVFCQAAANPAIPVAEIDIIPQQEKNRLLYEFNNTRTIIPGIRPFIDYSRNR